jgi:deoxyribonuclease V
VIERVGVRADAAFPYVPGLLSFREAPPILEAFAKLRAQPDAVLVDGQGIAHPRRLGLASHLGLWLDLPTIGCAKSRLCGVFTEPGTARGATSPLLLDGAQIGDVVRTRKRCKPLFVSPGHRCDQASATRLVLELAIPFRLPTPTRLAHSFVNDIRKAAT